MRAEGSLPSSLTWLLKEVHIVGHNMAFLEQVIRKKETETETELEVTVPFGT